MCCNHAFFTNKMLAVQISIIIIIIVIVGVGLFVTIVLLTGITILYCYIRKSSNNRNHDDERPHDITNPIYRPQQTSVCKYQDN